MAKASIPYFTIEEFKKWIDYDPITGQVRWSQDPSIKPSFRGKLLPRNPKGYIVTRIKGDKTRAETRSFSLHRLIYGAYVLGYSGRHGD